MPNTIDLGQLGSRGFVIEGDADFDGAGYSVSAAGDVNGDGFDDIIIGAYGNDSGGTDAGAAYVIFGRAGGFGPVDLGNLQPSVGFKIQGNEAYDGAGRSVSGAGDVNGDGFDDIVVGASYYGFYDSTAHAYVIFGKAGGFGTVDLTGLAASSGFVITGEITAYSSFDVAGAGDVNGDGFDDIIIGVSYDNGTAGAAYVIFGKTGGFGAIDLANIAPSAGFEISGAVADDQAGHSVAAAGDVNGDGFDDLIFGAPPGFFGIGAAAEAYVVFGRSNLTAINLATLTATQGFAIQGDNAGQWAGSAVSGAGDINGDGFADVIVGAMSGSLGGADAGEAYVIFGKAGGFGTVDLANLGAGGFIIRGDMAGDMVGASVSAAGDVNGDGFDDLIIGAPYGDNAANDAGEAYVIFGKASGFTTIDLTNFSTTDGFIIEGRAADGLVAVSVSGAGDFNGDGLADLLVGNPLAFQGNTAGSAYVVFGTTGVAVNDVRNDFNGDGRSDILWRHDSGLLTSWLGQANGGFIDNGSNAFNNIATSWLVTGTGDFNGDGRDDILWRHTSGLLTEWLGTATGGFVDNGANAFNNIASSWQVTGTGDFNGDGRDDILWRHDSGLLTEWLGQANGGFTDNGANAFNNIASSWQVTGVGDFNGDGRDDILWRHNTGLLTEWLGQANGGFVDNGANAFNNIATSWQVTGTGDFNGDGRDDILWRHDSGLLTEWLGTASGGFTDNGANAFNNIAPSWSVTSVGDFNGDGRDDILWRHESGLLTEWLGTATGGFVDNGANAFNNIATSWQVQPEDPFL